jgi:hypothetical protein
MARTRQQAPTGRELEVINSGRIAEFLGVAAVPQPGGGDDGNGASNVVRPGRWGRRDGTLVAGRASRTGTTLVINRPSDVWPWLARRKDSDDKTKGTVLLALASFLVLVLAAGQGYVSWFAQYRFIYAAKHAILASGIEALGLDTGAVIFALLALALVRLQRRAIVPRILNVSCACGSLAMNVLAADLHSVRSMVIFALPSALYATASDQLIAVVRRHALPAKVDEDEQRSSWAMAWRAVVKVTRVLALTVAWVLRVPLYLLRLAVAPGETYGGLRQLLLALTPLPQGELETADQDTSSGGGDGRKDRRRRRRKGGRGAAPTKKSVLWKLYAGQPGYGDRTQVTRIAKAIAAQAGLGEGTARAYLYELLDKTPPEDLEKVRRELTEGGAAA